MRSPTCPFWHIEFGSDVSPLLSTPGTQGTAIAIPEYSTYIRLTWYIYTYQIDAEMCSRDENKYWPQPVRNGPYHDRNDTSTDSTKSSGRGEDGETGKWRHKLEFLKEMIVGVDILLVVTSVITFGVNQFGNEWLSFLSDSKPAIGTLGGMYFLSLVFRTNICDRLVPKLKILLF